MSVTERHPEVVDASAAPIGDAELLTARDVPLGGPRAMTVHRTLPQRRRSLIGPWCFVDHYGPDAVEERGGMRVPGHPHIGLQTVTWLFDGEVEHRDTTGVSALIRPGEVNLMTAGDGVAHSEFSTAGTRRVHGVQLWIALPDSARRGDRGFEHYTPPLVRSGTATALVFLGEWLGEHATPRTASPAMAAEVRIPAGTTWTAALDPAFETGVLVDSGDVTVDGVLASRTELVALPAGRDTLTIEAGADADARLLIIGGEPLGESIVMWWNFVGRSHDEIVDARADWQRQVEQSRATGSADGRFGPHPSGWTDVLPAPQLPSVHLRPRT